MTKTTMSRGEATAGADATSTGRVMDALRRIVRALSASARVAPEGGVSGAQLFVLRQIAAAPGLTVGDLAARTLARQSSVSEVVRRLADRGLVARAVGAEDARRTELTLTKEGRRLVDGVAPTAQERLVAGLEALSDERRAELAALLESWLAAAELGHIEPAMFFEEGAR